MVFMSDVTQILNRLENGDPNGASELLHLVYDELRLLARQKLAHELPGQTLQAVAGFARIQSSLNSCESSYESWCIFSFHLP